MSSFKRSVYLYALLLFSLHLHASESQVSLFFLHDTIPASDTAIFGTVEVEASFPGGEDGWRNFLIQNLNANIPVERGAPAGQYTVWVQFIVDKEGKVSDISALTRNGHGMETEVIRILRKSPLWIPAQQEHRLVKAYRKQPVTFVVQEEKKKRRNRD